MDETVLVKTIDDVRVSAEGILLGLSTVHVKATHNSGASNPRLVPMLSDSPGILKLGLYVESNALTVMTPVEAKLEFIGFHRVCVQGQDNEICVDVPQ